MLKPIFQFGFLPRTFCLPADTKLLRKVTGVSPASNVVSLQVWERKGGKGRWIVKPPALARGCGIKVSLCEANILKQGYSTLTPPKVVNKWSQIPKTRPLVVQRYVARPYLINGENTLQCIGKPINA